jgi:GTP cyclohydrolase I
VRAPHATIFGKHVAYIPNGKIVGLKIPRIGFARMQVQERLMTK